MTPAEPEDWKHRRFGACFTRSGEQTVLKLRGKGGKDRQHPAHPEVLHAIGEYLAKSGGSWLDTAPVFMTRHGRPVSRPAMKHVLTRRCEQAGVKRVSPHGLRHSNITMLIDAGADLARIADHAGHSNINTTMRYFRDRDSLEKSPINGISLAG